MLLSFEYFILRVIFRAYKTAIDLFVFFFFFTIQSNLDYSDSLGLE